MIVINFKEEAEYPNLKEGQVVVCTQPSFFCDGTKHTIGQRFVVSKKDSAYFSIFLGQGYELYN